MIASRLAGLALAAALLLHSRGAHPHPLDDPGLTMRALASHAQNDCQARSRWGLEGSQACMSRAMASASRIGSQMQSNPQARPQLWRCLDRLEAGTLRKPVGGSHLDRVDACINRSGR